MDKEWFPSLEEYNPRITKEQWTSFVQDKNIFDENSLITFACIQKAKIATCADMAEEFGRSFNFYNTNNWRTGERIFKKTNCPLSEREEGGNRFWSVCCLGRESNKGRFELKIRPELQEAFEETGILEGIEVMEGKNISCIMANIAWNENNWKSPSYNKTNFRWTQVEGNIPHESWNFDFDNPRNTEKKIFGFIQFTHPPKNAEKDRFLIIFRSLNKIVGFYGNAEIKKEAVKKNEYEYSNIIGDKELVVLLDNKIDDSDNNFLFGKDRVGMIGFNYLNTNNAQKILDEAIKLNPNQIEILNDIKQWLPQGDTQMTDYEKKLDEIKNNLSVNRNVILTGAPGTGKTFMAKTVAARIILEREINDFDKDLTEEEKKQVESQTDFVQFHPSYDYTDFVEGLRPKQVDGSDQIGFERKDGVFKAFCEKTLKESYRENNDNVDNFEECWKKLVDELNENDFVTIPLISGKGDFRVELNEYGTGLANRTYENDDYQKGKWIQGKSKFFSKDQLYNIYQGLPGTPAGGHDNYRKAVVEYMKKNLGLLDYKKTESTQKAKKNFVFIIDEINRGEVAKIFGELFYCIDPGYRGEKGRISTQYQNLVTSGEFQKGFFIPENVYIIGTMNDIDRSVESMDFAFRRRFSWIEVKASDTVDMLYPSTNENGESTGLESKELAEEAKRRMENLNAAISKIEDLNEAYHIGASYFLKLKNYGGDFGKLWDYHLKGILQEYLRGNPNGKLEDLKAAYDKKEELKAGE